MSSKSLAPSRSFCSFREDHLVLSALKKSDLDASVLLRVCEEEGAAVNTPVEFLGQTAPFREVNLLEQDSGGEQQALQVGPFAIKTLRFNVSPAH